MLRYTTGFGVSPTIRFDLLLNALVHDAVLHGRMQVLESALRWGFVHVDDMAAAVLFALDRWGDVVGEVLNVGDERLNTTKGEIARHIADAFSARLDVGDFGHDAELRDQFVSFEKLARVGFRAHPSSTTSEDVTVDVGTARHH